MFKMEKYTDELPTFMEFCDGTKVPFGEKNDRGIYQIHHRTTMNGEYGGYEVLPIYGVVDSIGDDVPKYRYRIFIGEPPHKNENGEWVTYNEVPNFIVGSFGGGYEMYERPDVPHVIDMTTMSFYQKATHSSDELLKEKNAELYELRQAVHECSFKTYLNGLKNRMAWKFGKFCHYNGKRIDIRKYELLRKEFGVAICKNKETNSRYAYIVTEKWIRWMYITENGKLKIKFSKNENDHTCCSCD